jgi:hypothetical protein
VLPIVISLSISLVGVLAAVLLVSLALRGRKEDEPEPPMRVASLSGRFFLDEVADPMSQLTLTPEARRAQLEKHVREEQEAAEAFLQTPSAESLHAPPSSKGRK